MNDIVKPLTPDGMCGWDARGQLCMKEVREDSVITRIIGDSRGHKCRICLQGWILTAESLKDQFRWTNFDEWVHFSCYMRYRAMEERDMWFSALIAADVRFKPLKEIPNAYWVNDPIFSKKPWYTTEILDRRIDLKLGFRKHVYSIEAFSRGDALAGWEDAEKAFSDQEVTKAFSMDKILVHAHSVDAVRDYLKRLSVALGFFKVAETVQPGEEAVGRDWKPGDEAFAPGDPEPQPVTVVEILANDWVLVHYENGGPDLRWKCWELKPRESHQRLER